MILFLILSLTQFRSQLIFQILHQFRHDLIDHLIVQRLSFILKQEADRIRFLTCFDVLTFVYLSLIHI